ncbi:iron-dicitrate transporter subunit FecD [Escherichia coli]|uniref:Iron-dicitrate transporter subunit FecD n=1 Tax=Escherichia coli TaxID=562 RepID=A0A376U1T4_ECOLX|nr:iron-dicitrate transporter subunit FecD [Escherichia coli]
MVLPLLAFAGGHGGVDITEDAGKDPPADEAGAHRRGAFCMLGQPDGLSDALAPAGCEQRPAVADRQLMGRDWSFVKIAIPLMILFLPLSLSFCRDLDLLALGDARATTLGVSVPPYPILGFVTSCRHDIYRRGRLRPD